MPKIESVFNRSIVNITKCILVLYTSVSFSQNDNFIIPDSLKNQSFESLLGKALKSSQTDTISAVLYGRAYLQKAKQEKDSITIAEGYNLLAAFETDELKKIALFDRAIAVSKDLKYAYYPMVVYSRKGGFLRRKNRFGPALDNYLKVLELAKHYKKEEYVYSTMHNIATIKHDIGRDDEALTIYKQCLTREIARKDLDTFDYLMTIRGLSESYSRNNILDSAALYINEGLKLSETSYKGLHSTFLINQGINLYREQKYKLSQDVLKLALKEVNKNETKYKRYISRCHFYLGQIELVFNNSSKAEQHFLSIDSLIKKEAIVLPELRKGYEFLMNYYKNTNRNSNYLETIDQILKFDSILYNDRGLISDRLIREYDTPMILLEKENAILALQKEKKSLGNGLIISVFISVVAIILFYVQFRKRKIYKKRFEALMSPETDVSSNNKQIEKITEELDISDKIVIPTLEALKDFEKEKLFLNKNITTSSLSKEIGTNSKYLSKIINHYKEKTFTQYVNDLRINYAVECLKVDNRLRRYTIQGIADEMGFNTAESFSSAFKRSTGIKPSYFIKKISKAA